VRESCGGKQLKIEPPTFRLIVAPGDSILDPPCILPSVFVIVQLAFSVLLSQVKLVNLSRRIVYMAEPSKLA